LPVLLKRKLKNIFKNKARLRICAHGELYRAVALPFLPAASCGRILLDVRCLHRHPRTLRPPSTCCPGPARLGDLRAFPRSQAGFRVLWKSPQRCPHPSPDGMVLWPVGSCVHAHLLPGPDLILIFFGVAEAAAGAGEALQPRSALLPSDGGHDHLAFRSCCRGIFPSHSPIHFLLASPYRALLRTTTRGCFGRFLRVVREGESAWRPPVHGVASAASMRTRCRVVRSIPLDRR